TCISLRMHEHRLQAVCDLSCLFIREHPGSAQTFSMSKARAHIGGKEPTVEAKGTIERSKSFIRRFTKTPTPQIFRLAQDNLLASSELIQCNIHAILCIYAALMQPGCISFCAMDKERRQQKLLSLIRVK